MATELVLLGTAGAPLPVAGRAGISSALVVDGRVFVVDCGRGSPSGYADAGLDFRHLEAILLTHLHVDHTGDLAGMLLYPWGVRGGHAPVRVHGPGRPEPLPRGTPPFRAETLVHPELPDPCTAALVERIVAGYAYHLNVMPLDAEMPDAGALVRVHEFPARAAGRIEVFADATVTVTATPVSHGHAVPAFAYRFDTPDGAVVFSGDTTVDDRLATLAHDADVLVHAVADLGHLERHGVAGAALERMAALHTDVDAVGEVATRAGVRRLVLTHYVPAEPGAVPDAEWERRAARGFAIRTIAGHDGMRLLVAGRRR